MSQRPSMPLNNLLEGLDVIARVGDDNPAITGVLADSRKAAGGSLFVAVAGNAVDGHDFIDEAWRRGAAAVVVDRRDDFERRKKTIPAGRVFCLVPDSRCALARLAAGWHGFPAHSMVMVGITGTNGKTTIAYLLEHLLARAGHRVGVVSTVNYRFAGLEQPAAHTTPGADDLQALLRRMVDAGTTCCVMEVSSHALDQQRAGEIPFSVVIFTNLSHEHLDYHREMESYFQAKKQLFTGCGGRAFKVINGDDRWGRRLLGEVEDPKLSYGLAPEVEFRALEPEFSSLGTTFTIEAAGERWRCCHSPLIGRFNVLNVLAALAAARQLGGTMELLLEAVESFPQVPGRLQRVPNQRDLHILVDYAHTPDALEKVLSALRECVREGRLLTLFGCGGDRDRRKRPEMGRVAQRYSDLVVVTSDNPRHEDPEQIIADILAGMAPSEKLIVEKDRRRAIAAVIAAGRPGDLLLIAGKGHESYQQVGDQRLPFDDVQVVKEVLAA